jgi:hypothetical protein
MALLVVFALSGCDAILEFAFPDETGGGDEEGWGQSSISLTVTIGEVSLPWRDNQVYVELQKDGGAFPNNIRKQFASQPSKGEAPVATFYFDGLTDGTYRAQAWIETTNNGFPDKGEPQAPAETQDGAEEVRLDAKRPSVGLKAELRSAG